MLDLSLTISPPFRRHTHLLSFQLLTLTKPADRVDGISDRTDVLVVFSADLQGHRIRAFKPPSSDKSLNICNQFDPKLHGWEFPVELDILQRAQLWRQSSLLPAQHRPASGRCWDRSSRSASISGNRRLVKFQAPWLLARLVAHCDGQCTSSGNLIPFKLCSEPSNVALQRPQWKVILPTRKRELRPPPLTKKSPSTLMATGTQMHVCTFFHCSSLCLRV